MALRVARAFELGRQHRAAHREAQAKGVYDVAEHRGVADGRQACLPHYPANYQHVHSVVEGLQEIPQEKRQGEGGKFFRHAAGKQAAI